MQYIAFLKSSLLPSLLSGSCASLGSVFGKLAFSPVQEHPLLSYVSHQDIYIFLLRVILFVIMLFFNSLMMKLFLTSLSRNGASRAAIYNFSVNYFLTVRVVESQAFFGVVFFGEIISLKWMAGACLMMLGIGLIAAEKQASDKEKKD